MEDVMKRWIAIAAAVVVAGCGGEDRLTKAETASELNGAVGTLNAEFQAIFEELGRKPEDARVPAALRERLAGAAEVERRGAEQLATLEPVEGADAAVDEFIEAARAQAEALAEAASQSNLTVAEMADAIELPAMREALTELARQDLVEPPGHS
jgi:hypothetical protein